MTGKKIVLNSLRELPDAKEKWQGVKDLKRDSQPQFVRLRNLDGQLVAPKDRAESIADYLEKRHWSNPIYKDLQRNDSIHALQDSFNTAAFTVAEFDAAPKTIRNNKQAGPDKLQMELFKWMNFTNRSWMLQLINIWWQDKCAPHDVFLARVVSIFKKGDTDLPENYRPISLLNSMYKIYMIMIRKRLQDVLEEHLCETQFGFRPSHSTSQAIFITRRLQDVLNNRLQI